MTTAYLTVFIFYFIMVFSVGYIASRFTHNTHEFVLADRQLGPLLVALGAGASDMSGWLMMGVPGAAYIFGMNQIWMPLGLSIGALLNWTLVAQRLRVYTELAKNSLTIPAFFENRYHDHKGILRLVTSIAVIIFFTFYVSSGFVGAAVLFQTTFNLSYIHALLLGGFIIIFYTSVGGFLGVNWLDLIQGTLMWIALLTVPIVTFFVLKHPHADATTPSLAHIWHITPLGTIGVMSLMAWGLGYFGQPHILMRFMSIKHPSHIRQSTVICMSWMVMSMLGAIFTGILGSVYFSSHPLAHPESVFLDLGKALFNPYITGILLAAVLSAIMNAIAAQLLASACSLAEDVYIRYFYRTHSAKGRLRVNRATVLIIALVALFLAHNPQSTVLNLVSYAWAGLGASFGPLMLCSLFWRRTTRNGAIAGIVAGAVTIIVWKQLAVFGGIFNLYEILPAFVIGMFAIIIVSLLDKQPNVKVLNDFDKFQKTLRTVDNSLG